MSFLPIGIIAYVDFLCNILRKNLSCSVAEKSTDFGESQQSSNKIIDIRLYGNIFKD